MLKPMGRVPTFLLMLACLGLAGAAFAEAPKPPKRVKTLGADRLKRGMRGFGLSVFQDSKIERFEVEIIDVVKNVFSKQDMILARCSHPILNDAKIVAGMSGSPVYVTVDGEDRLIGALAYGWSFQVHSICGITPIGDMLAELDRDQALREAKKKGSDKKKVGAGDEKVGPDLIQTTAKPMAKRMASGVPFVPWGIYKERDERLRGLADHKVVTEILRQRLGGPRGQVRWGGYELKPVATPLMIGGMSAKRMGWLEPLLNGLGMVPLPMGGAGRTAGSKGGTVNGVETPGKLVPGGGIGVQLIGGDLDWTAIGTVTYVDERGVLAFGHPMWGGGEVSMRATGAHVHTVVASQWRSFKMASPAKFAGAIVQDRQSCIVARPGAQAKLVPVDVFVTGGADGKKQEFHYEVMRHDSLSSILTLYAILYSMDAAEPSQDNNTIHVRQVLKFEGQEPMEYSDVYAASGSFAYGILAPLDALNTDRWGKTYLERAEYHIQVRKGRKTTVIETVRSARTEVRAGEKITLDLVLHPYAGKRFTLKVPVQVPAEPKTGTLQVSIAGGNNTSPTLPVPENMKGLIENIRRLYRSTDLVVTIARPGTGIRHRGRLLPRLPASVLNVLAPPNDTDRPTTTTENVQSVMPTEWVLYGSASISLPVVGSR